MFNDMVLVVITNIICFIFKCLFFLGDGDKLLPARIQGIILLVKAYVAPK